MKRMVFTLLSGVALFFGAVPVQAQSILVDVSGGTGNTPLTVDVLNGGTFTASAGGGGLVFVVLENFWDNSNSNFSHGASTRTTGLNGSTDPGATGAGDSAGFQLDDLLFGFNGVPGFVASDAIMLTAGTRVTADGLSLNYTAVNGSGTAHVRALNGTIITDSIAWSSVPEPSTYGWIVGLGCVVFAVVRRRRLGAGLA